MPNLTTLEFAACAVIGFITLCSVACYITTWATPRTEDEPEIPEKSGYLAEIEKIDEERV